MKSNEREGSSGDPPAFPAGKKQYNRCARVLCERKQGDRLPVQLVFGINASGGIGETFGGTQKNALRHPGKKPDRYFVCYPAGYRQRRASPFDGTEGFLPA